MSSIKVAEASKVIENAQRDINIAFVNEVMMLAKALNIDSHEVLRLQKLNGIFKLSTRSCRRPLYRS